MSRAAALSRSAAAARRLRALEAEDAARQPGGTSPFAARQPGGMSPFAASFLPASRSFVVACVVDTEEEADAAVDCAASMLAVLLDGGMQVTFEVRAASEVAESLTAALGELAWGTQTGFRVVPRPGSITGPSTAAAICCCVRSAVIAAASESSILVWISPFALFVDPAAFDALAGGDASCVMSLRNGLGFGAGDAVSTRLLVVPPIRSSVFASVCSVAEAEVRRPIRVPVGADALLTRAASRVGIRVHPLSSLLFPSCARSRLPQAMPPGTLIVFALP